MKATQISSYGGVEVLEVKTDVAEPSAGEGQVLVEVHAASLNPFDWKVREGYTKEYLKLDFPVTLGGDFSGVVMGIGENVEDLKQSLRSSPVRRVAGLKIGDEVYGQAAVFAGGTGAFAELVAANVGKIAKKPQNISFEDAAALPLVGISALQALETHINLKPNQKVLIVGGAGGIGSVAVQIAKALGAYVAASAGGDDLDFVKSLGADEVYDYKENFWEKIHEFDAVFDTAGKETDKVFEVVKKGGVVVWMTGSPDLELAKKLGVVAIAQNTEGNTQRLDRLRELVESGEVRPQVDKVFDLEKVKEAFTHLETGHPRGKVVLKIYD